MSKKDSRGNEPPAGPDRAGETQEHPLEKTLSLRGEQVDTFVRDSVLPFDSTTSGRGTASPWTQDTGSPDAAVSRPEHEQAEARWVPPSPPRPSSQVATSSEAATAAPHAEEVNHLLWYDAEQMERIRSVERWSSLLDEAEERPVDTEAAALDAAAEGLPEDHRDVFEIITRGAAADRDQLHREAHRAYRDDGKYIPPLVLLEGDLRVLFDPEKMLLVTADLAGALASGDELDRKLKHARKLLGSAAASIRSIVDRHVHEIRGVFAVAAPSLPGHFLAIETERLLVKDRAYEIHSVFGGDFLHGALSIEGDRPPETVYLPEEVAKLLPICPSFRVRLLADVHLNQQADAHQHPPKEGGEAVSLKAVGLSHVTPRPTQEKR